MSDDSLSSQLAQLRIQREPRPGGGGFLRVLAVVAVAGAVGTAVYAARDRIRERVSSEEISLTSVTTVAAGGSEVLLTSTGYVSARRKSAVAAKVTGRLKKLHVDEGQHVEAGQLIAELDPEDAEAAHSSSAASVHAAQARVLQTNADEEEAKRVLARQKALTAEGVAPADLVKTAAARLALARASQKAAKADVVAAQANVKGTKVTLDSLKVYAPFGGVIVKKVAEVGEMVGPGSGSFQANVPSGGIVMLADFETLEVEAEVTEGRLGQIKPGLPTEVVLDAFPDERRRGEVASIRPSVDRSKATVSVWVKFVDGTKGVLPDMAAKVRFLAEALDPKKLAEPPKIVVPRSALAERSGVRVVFVVKDGHAVQTAVTLGEAVGSAFVLKQGPSVGAQLVDSPRETLADGAPVKLKGG